MSELRVQQKLPLGVAWHWVKFSFASFREKPINFMFFAMSFLLFSLLPFFGSFLSVLVIARIYFSIAKVGKQQPFGLALQLGEIFKQRNIVNYALFNMLFDLLAMSSFQQLLIYLHLDNKNPAMILDHRVLLVLVGFSIFRSIFFGISLAIVTFNPQLRVWSALILNWKFVLKHWVVVALGLFLLLPFLLVPMYIAVVVALSVSNNLLFAISASILLIIMLLFMLVTTIFSYKLYQDGIIRE